MSRDLYPALSGALGAERSLEQIANNLANVSTTAFKATRLSFQLSGPSPHPLGQAFAETLAPMTDPRDGAVVRDDVPTHFALQGQGYFVLQGDGAEPILTRDGRFALDTEQRLADPSGRLVMGENGPIEIPRGETVQVNVDGTVIGSISGPLDKLRVAIPEGGAKPIGGNRYAPSGALREVEAHVVQGALEASNVDPLASMVELVEASRYFEAFQKAMQASDELDARLNQSAGGR